MIHAEKLKPFFLDMDDNIRKEVGQYFYEGYIREPEILPLTLQACRKYGFEENVLLLFYAQRQQMDDLIAAELFEILRETKSENLQFHLIHLLNNAGIGFLEEHHQQMQQPGRERLWSRAKNRLKFQGLSVQQLWDILNEYAKVCTNDKADANYYEPLIEQLAYSHYPEADQIVELIDAEAVQGQWLELFLIKLAGARKIEQAIPIINQRLAGDDFGLTETSSKALTQIGTDAVVNMLREGCKSGSWDYQLAAADILGRIKLPQSESAIIDLLENHKHILPHDIYCHLCFSLCDLFSNRAFHFGKEILDDIEAIQFDSVRERVIILSVVLGTPLSPETRKQWEREMAQEPQRRKEYNRKRYPALYNFGELIRTRFGEDGNFIRESDLDIERSSKRRIESIGSFSPELKIGRNDPCRCGSGKKYKKCCGKNSGLKNGSIIDA